MKTLTGILRLTVVLFGLLLLAPGLKAQKGDIYGGLGLNFTSDIGAAGISLEGVYVINSTWEGAVSYTYIFEKDMVNWSLLNFDAHYLFNSTEENKIYGIGGLNITFFSVDFGTIMGYDTGSTTGSEMGLNIGVGDRYKLSDNLHLMGELTYTLGGANFVNIGVGVLYNF